VIYSSGICSLQSRDAEGRLRGCRRSDVSALSDLFAPDTVWTGIERGFFWWKHAPS
jgi:ketosteroid isomerase-like protein